MNSSKAKLTELRAKILHRLELNPVSLIENSIYYTLNYYQQLVDQYGLYYGNSNSFKSKTENRVFMPSILYIIKYNFAIIFIQSCLRISQELTNVPDRKYLLYLRPDVFRINSIYTELTHICWSSINVLFLRSLNLKK